MKTTPSLKPKPETPKTPGGISKSLLTPCRRVGLSRNWRKSAACPFQSPLQSTDTQSNVETRKRKGTSEETPLKGENAELLEDTGTPTRKVDLPHRKKSKALLNCINIDQEDDSSRSSPTTEKTDEKPVKQTGHNIPMEIEDTESTVVSTPVRLKSATKKLRVTNVIDDEDKTVISQVSTPVRLKSKIGSKKISPKSISKVQDTDSNHDAINDKLNQKENTTMTTEISNENVEKKVNSNNNNKQKKISPNKLIKECIVVVQKKIFKKELHENYMKTKPVSQTLYEDSDSDDVPLKCLNKPESDKKDNIITIDDDNDFTVSSNQKLIKTNYKAKDKSISKKKPLTDINKTVVLNPTQSSIDEDDFFEKKTILIRKTYDKVIKPAKAKSTGSITQKDIEEMKARIEAKKKILLAKSMTDTKELRELIKKWKKGCQDALMELMDLMKSKCPDNQNMEYSKILQTLNIPAMLVGYDPDNDCFVTPEDENIILSHVKE